jgi:molecular chaperone GrpE (heat shock protein)
MNENFNEEITGLRKNLSAIETKIAKTKAEKENLESQTQDSSNKLMTETTYDKISKEVCRILDRFSGSSGKVNTNRPTLEILLEIEKLLDKQINCYQLIKQEDLQNRNIAKDTLTKIRLQIR